MATDKDVAEELGLSLSEYMELSDALAFAYRIDLKAEVTLEDWKNDPE